MDFISMDLIGEFHPPSTHGNKYALNCYFACYQAGPGAFQSRTKPHL